MGKVDIVLADVAREIDVEGWSDEDRVALRNGLMQLISDRVSPRQISAHPVDCVRWERPADIEPNDWNPNSVAPPEMRLLKLSIEEDGYTQPVVALGGTVVDGFHRWRCARESRAIKRATQGYVPVVRLSREPTRQEAQASTIRHNQARGKHAISGMTAIVRDMVESGWGDERIAKELGMGPDEVLRLKQLTGIAALFDDDEWSEAWE